MSSSSSESGALTRRRRPSRRQPLRRCKRFRGNPGGGPFLMDITEPVLRHILEFTMWDDEEEDDTARCLALWKWTGELGIVCRVFRRVARQVAPDELHCNRTINSLLRSFQEFPWKKTNLVKLSCFDDVHLPSLLALFEQPDSLPNLEKLELSSLRNATFLYNLARSCPNLSELRFDLDAMMTPDEFGTFGQMLRHPLHTLHLGKWSASWMTGAHLGAFLRHQGQNLTYMILIGNSVTDAWLVHVAQYCRNLEKFRMISKKITSEGLRTFLQATPSLREFDVDSRWSEEWSEPGLTVVDILIQHAPQLEKIRFVWCRWFTDELLDQLVQRQIDYWTDRGQPIRLSSINASWTSVTRDGVDRVLAKPNVGNLDIWGQV